MAIENIRYYILINRGLSPIIPDSKKRRSFLTLLFTAGDLRR